MPATQDKRLISVYSPLAKDTVLFQRMLGSERLGRPYQYELDLLSDNPELDFSDFLGQHLTVEVEMPDGGIRCFDGLASRFRQIGTSGRYYWYQATLRPWVWFLSRTHDCRIFQDLNAVDIIKKVFRDHRIAEFEESLSGSYRTRTYCVQYRESDLDFVTRLMEEEGIYYYFKHDHGKHTLVLSDAYSAHEPTPGYEQVPYFPPENRDRRERDHIYDWQLSRDLQTGSVALDDFDFERPKADLAVVSSIPREHSLAEMEVFDYPGGYLQLGDGEQYARVAIEADHARFEVARGEGDARGLTTGGLFELVDYPRGDQNREYLILAAEYQLISDLYESANVPEGEIVFIVGFEAMDSRQPYRLPRVTPKAVVRGPQTAMVVGEKGEEITTDEYGRVKVQFHWDRYGKADKNSSCWVRVAQVWAGAQWGGMHIPRIGQRSLSTFWRVTRTAQSSPDGSTMRTACRPIPCPAMPP
jgi:type VI secretion system secreted protein VgrG